MSAVGDRREIAGAFVPIIARSALASVIAGSALATLVWTYGFPDAPLSVVPTLCLLITGFLFTFGTILGVPTAEYVLRSLRTPISRLSVIIFAAGLLGLMVGAVFGPMVLFSVPAALMYVLIFMCLDFAALKRGSLFLSKDRSHA